MLRKLTDMIYYLPNDESTDRPSIGYVKGRKYSLMVDAGASPLHVQLFLHELEQNGLKRPDFVFLTHWHWDHVFGLATLKESNVLSIACKLTNERLIKMRTWEWTPEAIESRLSTGEDVEFCMRMMEMEYPGFRHIQIATAEITFEDRLVLDLGGITCELLRVGGPHTEDSVICFVQEEKVLFLGDASGEDLLQVPAREYRCKLGDLLHRLEPLPFELVVPGHWGDEKRDDTLRDICLEMEKTENELYHIPSSMQVADGK